MEKLKLYFRFVWFLIKRFSLKIAEIKKYLPDWNYKKIISIILICLLAFGIFSAVFDSIRVGNEKEPIFTAKSVSKEPLKITYTGLGYKVIRYPRVSEYEPFENNIGVKFGTWFLKFEAEDIVMKHELLDIIDLTTIEILPCDDMVETFYQDENYIYQFPCVKGKYVLAHFKDGTESTVADALTNGDITIEDLDEWKIEYIKTKK